MTLDLRRRDLRASLLLGLFCLLVYNANLRAISAGDCYPARYLPFAIWRHHTVLLDPIAPLTALPSITDPVVIDGTSQPGYVDTPLLDAVPETVRQVTVMQTPIGRLGTPGEIAALALFLATDEAGFFVGATLSPNGGYVTT